jgi:hypothetical protein
MFCEVISIIRYDFCVNQGWITALTSKHQDCIDLKITQMYFYLCNRLDLVQVAGVKGGEGSFTPQSCLSTNPG